MIPEDTSAGESLEFLPLFDHGGSPASRPLVRLVGPLQEVGQQHDQPALHLPPIPPRHV